MPVLASRSAVAARMRRATGLDWEPTSMADAIARWERIERDILLETNARHDAEHAQDPWFQLARGSLALWLFAAPGAQFAPPASSSRLLAAAMKDFPGRLKGNWRTFKSFY